MNEKEKELEKEKIELTTALNFCFGLISTMDGFENKNLNEIEAWVFEQVKKENKKSLSEKWNDTIWDQKEIDIIWCQAILRSYEKTLGEKWKY